MDLWIEFYFALSEKWAVGVMGCRNNATHPTVPGVYNSVGEKVLSYVFVGSMLI
jgi:hypothetical protein